jgi:pyrroline-5-carboxylate reductase
VTEKARKLGFIGAGNMAGALIRGLIKVGPYKAIDLAASDSDAGKLGELAEETGIKAYFSNTELVSNCAAVVLAVKPQVMGEVLEGIRDEVRDDHIFFSVAAGITLSGIGKGLGRSIPIVRVMPNTPALIGKGISALAAGEQVSLEHMEMAHGIFGSVGETITVDETMMDAVTAMSGSGPGFVFRIMEAFVRAGEKVGFDKENSIKLVLNTFLGAAHLALQSEKSLSDLRKMVASPGGTTQAGLEVMESLEMERIVQNSVVAARDRSEELGREEA